MVPCKLLSSRILILPAPVQEMSPGGLHLPPSAQQKESMGTVVATGPGKFEGFNFHYPNTEDQGGGYPVVVKPITVQVGDKVLFSKFAGGTIEIKGTEYQWMDEDHVIAILMDEVVA